MTEHEKDSLDYLDAADLRRIPEEQQKLLARAHRRGRNLVWKIACRYDVVIHTSDLSDNWLVSYDREIFSEFDEDTYWPDPVRQVFAELRQVDALMDAVGIGFSNGLTFDPQEKISGK